MKATPLVGPTEGSARVLSRLAGVNNNGRSLTSSSPLSGSPSFAARAAAAPDTVRAGCLGDLRQGTRVFFRGPSRLDWSGPKMAVRRRASPPSEAVNVQEGVT